MTTTPQALRIIEEAIAAHGAPPGEPTSLASTDWESVMKQPSEAERFREAVDGFLRALDRIAIDYRDDDVAGWVHAVKPFLTTLVGWEASTALGRAASNEGYDALHAAWNRAWDGAQTESK
jgi:hypothetical protein